MRLAYNNLKKNRIVYLPFILATIFTVVLNIIMQVMLHNDGMDTLPQSGSVKMMFRLGSVIITIFSVIFTFYTHSFLIKRRKKELGLYNILGMGKKELTFMMFFENLYAFLLVMAGGIFSGVILSKLMFLVLKRMTGYGADFVYQLSFSSVLATLGLFTAIFVSTFVYDVWQVRKTKPIELMEQSKSGEQEPKSRTVMALIGVLCLAAGYTISLTIQSPVEALMQFFVAVVLVIIGTYCLFIAGSVSLLKALKGNKKFYYKPANFISISGMIFRMKQNGAGLASICILCTMTLVTLSSTVSLYVGSEDIIRNRNPFPNTVETTALSKDEVETVLSAAAQQQEVNVKDFQYLYTSAGMIILKTQEDTYVPAEERFSNYSNIRGLQLLKLSEYNRVRKADVRLANNDVLLYSVYGEYTEPDVTFGSQTFSVAVVPDTFSLYPKSEDSAAAVFLMAVPDDRYEEILAGLVKDFQESAFPVSAEQKTTLYFQLSGSLQQRLAVITTLREDLQQAAGPEAQISVSSIDEDREDNKILMGGFLFIGVVFGLSFIIATTLIIFYKQISEGNDDHDRFEIMQKVGLSRKEVHQTIQHQILLVFFLPITVAVIHLAFAFPIIQKLLVMFGLTNGGLLLLTTVICIGIFALCYFIIYWRTSKVYYLLVER